MSGPPDDAVLDSVAAATGANRRDIGLLRRRRYEYATSAVLEDLLVSVAGVERELILKHLSWAGLFGDAITSKQRWLHDPRRELGVYEELAGEGVTPGFCGGSAEAEGAWVLMERAPGVELWQVGDFAIWEAVAAWLGRFHSRLRDRVVQLAARNPALIQYDGAWVGRWSELAAASVARAGDPRADAVRSVAARHGDVVAEWAALTPVFVHGELYPSNVLVDDGAADLEVHPVDWEMAGIGPGALDLAALSGGWGPSERDDLITAYERAASHPEPDLRRQVNLARLHLALRWLAWADDWRPPTEHAHDWVAEALDSAADLGLA